MDPRLDLLDSDDMTQIDSIPAPLLHAALSSAAPSSGAGRKPRAPIPPPLPIPLVRRVEAAPLTDSDEIWLSTLPLASRAVLEAARHAQAEWPVAPRLAHAIATPVGALVDATLELSLDHDA